MPLTDELGNLCLTVDALADDSRVPAGGFTGNRFEIWLSELAADQPFLLTYENLANHALFLRFSDAIAEVLGERVVEVLAKPWRFWLPILLKVSHVTRSTLITFNYDPLVECAVRTGVVYQEGVGEVVWTEVIADVPPWPHGAIWSAGTPADTMLLLKLHGSLNWYWTPDDSSGASVARRTLPGRYGAPERYDEAERRRELPGRVPFVVPPTATKSRYYSNPIVRELWQNAAAALREADRIVFMGYSLPVTDLTFNAMLTNATPDEPPTLVVADTDGAGVAARLARLMPRSDVEVVADDGDGPIAAFVLRWSREVARGAAADLRARASALMSHPMFVGWRGDCQGAVTAVRVVGDTVVLTVEEPSTGLRRWRDGEVLPTLGDAIRLLPIDGAIVTETSCDTQDIIAWSEYRTDLGYGHGIWTVLTPSGPPPLTARAMPTTDVQ